MQPFGPMTLARVGIKGKNGTNLFFRPFFLCPFSCGWSSGNTHKSCSQAGLSTPAVYRDRRDNRRQRQKRPDDYAPAE